MTSKKSPAGLRKVRMTVAQAIRCAAMDAEASQPTGCMMIWQGADGRLHKRIFPTSQVIEDGLFSALDRLPPGPTDPAGARE
jgi:hypothetical protein